MWPVFLCPALRTSAPRCCRDLAGLSLDGELPFDSSVWQPLNSLTSVNLSGNDLSGFLPPQISELGNVTTLNFGGNNFNGVLFRM